MNFPERLVKTDELPAQLSSHPEDTFSRLAVPPVYSLPATVPSPDRFETRLKP